jgi:hypothetical protein
MQVRFLIFVYINDFTHVDLALPLHMKFSPCLIKHHAMKGYGEVEVYLHALVAPLYLWVRGPDTH